MPDVEMHRQHPLDILRSQPAYLDSRNADRHHVPIELSDDHCAVPACDHAVGDIQLNPAGFDKTSVRSGDAHQGLHHILDKLLCTPTAQELRRLWYCNAKHSPLRGRIAVLLIRIREYRLDMVHPRIPIRNFAFSTGRIYNSVNLPLHDRLLDFVHTRSDHRRVAQAPVDQRRRLPAERRLHKRRPMQRRHKAPIRELDNIADSQVRQWPLACHDEEEQAPVGKNVRAC
mmetsp:Transcript_108343/g.305497  ORF Transcript_108343/g.305497 Transcript_108343/m.305497 type:complete len:229 (-) Transcript_108343:2554-3240(-)